MRRTTDLLVGCALSASALAFVSIIELHEARAALRERPVVQYEKTAERTRTNDARERTVSSTTAPVRAAELETAPSLAIASSSPRKESVPDTQPSPVSTPAVTPDVVKPVPPEVSVNVVEKITPTKEPETPSLTSFATEFLSLHNRVRSSHGLRSLAWSDELAEGAASWAETLAGEQCKMRHSSEPYGENLFTLWSTDPSVDGTPEDAMDWWAGEEKYYDLDTNTCEKGEQCGHYTQIVWDTTTAVGCAITSWSDGRGDTELFVCRYSPQGNIVGQRPYENE